MAMTLCQKLLNHPLGKYSIIYYFSYPLEPLMTFMGNGHYMEGQVIDKAFWPGDRSQLMVAAKQQNHLQIYHMESETLERFLNRIATEAGHDLQHISNETFTAMLSTSQAWNDSLIYQPL